MKKVTLNKKVGELDAGEHEVTEARANYWKRLGLLDETKAKKKAKRKSKPKKAKEQDKKDIPDDF